MYKFVIIKGAERGKAFKLGQGTHLIGRVSECDISLQSDFISKKHATITVTADQILLEDLNSRNGTFVNGMMVQKTKLKPGDLVSFKDVILELRKTGHQKVTPQPPASMIPSGPGKKQKSTQRSIQSTFDPMFEKITERIEWKYFSLLLVFAFVIVGFGALVPPLLDQSKTKLQAEALKRGELIVKRLARDNQKHFNLDQGRLISDTLKLTTSLAASEPRILSINIIDSKTKRILAPPERLNQSIDNRSTILKGTTATSLMIQKLSTHQVVISQPIFVYDRAEDREVVGATVQAVFNVEGVGFSAGERTGILVRSLIILFILGIVFYALLQQSISAAFRKVYREIEAASRKGYRHLELQTKFDEMSQVVHSINKIFKKTRALIAKLPEDEREERESAIENTDDILKNLIHSLPEGVAVINDMYQILQINSAFEKWAGFKFDVSADQNLLDVIQDQELLRNITHGLGQATQTGEEVQEELTIKQDRFVLSISAAKNPEDEVEYYILNLRQAT